MAPKMSRMIWHNGAKLVLHNLHFRPLSNLHILFFVLSVQTVKVIDLSLHAYTYFWKFLEVALEFSLSIQLALYSAY